MLPTGSRADQAAAVETLGAGLGAQWAAYVDAFGPDWELLRRDHLERPFHPDLAPRELTRLLAGREMLSRRVKGPSATSACGWWPRTRSSPTVTIRATCPGGRA